MGYCFIRPFLWEESYQGLEIGALVKAQYWNQGVGSALGRFISDRLKDTDQLFAIIEDHNAAGIRIASRMGYAKIAASKKYPGQSIWGLRVSSTKGS